MGDRTLARGGRAGGAGFSPGKSRGFTLVEMLVTIVLVSLALVGVFSAIGSVTQAEAKAREADRLQRLAMQKMSEMGTVTDPRTAEASGDFAEQGQPDVTWSVEVEPSGSLNVEQVTVTTSRGNASQSLTGLVFLRPLTTATGTGG